MSKPGAGAGTAVTLALTVNGRRHRVRVPALKRLLMLHAMGTLGDRPRLAKGQLL